MMVLVKMHAFDSKIRKKNKEKKKKEHFSFSRIKTLCC